MATRQRQSHRAQCHRPDQELPRRRRRDRGAARGESDRRAGESVALTGESGSGKSTLLHLIAGLDAADGGEIRLDDALVSELTDSGRAELRRDRLGLVFQQFNLIPSLSVEDNLVFQSRIAGRHDAAWHRELVERLGLRISSSAIPSNYPAASSSASRSAARWRQSRCCCWRTSRPAISTRPPPTMCWRWRAIWSRAAAAVS